MNAADYRDLNFRELRERLAPQRVAVLEAWLKFGPGTTREVAARSGIDLLTLRPRTTELCQGGLVCLVEEGEERSEVLVDGKGAEAGTAHWPHSGRGAEGVYRARTIEEFEVWAQGRREGLVGRQLELV